MGRKKNTVKLKPVLFIACEGTSTEYQYFSSWAQTDISKQIFQQINVYPSKNDKNPKTTPYQLYEVAKDELKTGAANIAWIVFDKDGHPYIKETFRDAEKDDVKIAFSSRSFEEWVLMHFERNDNPFNATECKDEDDKPLNCGTNKVKNCAPIDCLTGHIRRKKYISNYSKKNTFDLYLAIKDLTEIALVNSSWLRFKFNASINKPPVDRSNLNPYTNVDELITMFQERKELLEWGSLNENITLDNWTIKLSKKGKNKILQLSHKNEEKLLVNKHFSDNVFFLTNDLINLETCNVVSKKILLNNNGSDNAWLMPKDVFEYTFEITNKNFFLFKPLNQSVKIFVELN